MPNWTKIAETIARGEFGEEWDKQKMRKAEIDSAAQRSRLLESAESRAQSAEGRTQDEFNWSKQQRPMLLEKLQNEVNAGKLSLEQAQNILDTFEASGGAKGAAERTMQEHTWKGNADQRAGEALGLERRRTGIAEEEFGLRKTDAERQGKFEDEINPYRVSAAENAADPRQKYSGDIMALRGIYEAALRNGDEETAKKMNERIDRLTMQQEAESIAWNQRRNARINPGGKDKPQGAPSAFKKSEGQPFNKKATPEIVRPSPPEQSGGKMSRFAVGDPGMWLELVRKMATYNPYDNDPESIRRKAEYDKQWLTEKNQGR